MNRSLFMIAGIVFSMNTYSQTIGFDKSNLEANHVYMSIEKMNGKQVVKVVKDSTQNGADLPTFVKIKGVDFKDGTIEIKVLSRLLKTAPASARGFIGVAFHIDPLNSRFEGIYLRPTNGRAEDQLRRNHSIQYFSYPDYGFDRLRKEAEGVYESYADMGLNEWITMRIVVKGKQAKLFLNDNKQPSLIVNDLKLGDNVSGAIGLWVDGGTEGYFKDLKITKQ
ncbi:MAG TPA: family 16 glycoside hydrolase [Chitinophagaceae bacterium]|nr:family 16 glycoside hydrolase [Chitinophagaceae bacterium]